MENTAVVVVRLRVRGNASVQVLAEEVVATLNTIASNQGGREVPFVESDTLGGDGQALTGWLEKAELVSSRLASWVPW